MLETALTIAILGAFSVAAVRIANEPPLRLVFYDHAIKISAALAILLVWL